jgi:hypothetical protein
LKESKMACSFQPPKRKHYKRPSAAAAAAVREVAAWNQAVATGATVCLHRDNGQDVITKTTTPAQVMHGSAVAWFEGISGCYSIDRAHVVEAR